MNDRKVIVILYSQETLTSAQTFANYINKVSESLYAVLVSEKDYDLKTKIAVRDFFKHFTFQTSYGQYKLYHNIKDIMFKKKTKKIIKNQNKNDFEIYKKINKDDLKKYKTFKTLQNMLLRYNPHGVLCTTFSSCDRMIKVKKMLELDSLRIFGLLSDYVLDDRFVDENVYGYFVQNQKMKDELIAKNFDFNFVEAVGTPLADNILDKHNRELTMKELGVEVIERPNILITTGKMGTAELKQIIFKLANSDINANFLFNTCNNPSVKFILKSVFKHDQLKRFYSIQELDDMSKLFSICDVAITAPTAIITYELFCNNIPCIIIPGISSSDKLNYNYLVSNKMGYGLEDQKDLEIILKKMLYNENFAFEFIKVSKEYSIPDTKKLVYEKLLNTVQDFEGVKKELEEKHYVDDIEEEENQNEEKIEIDEEMEIIKK